MRRSKTEVDRYISSLQNASPSYKEKPVKGFLFAKLYFEAKEYDLAKRHVSDYLKVQERDPKAHKFLGNLFEREGEINKAIGCYKRSVELNASQKELVLKIAELLVSQEECHSKAEFWVEKAAKQLPGNSAVFDLKERLLSRQGQQGWNQLLDLLQTELVARPADTHVNVKLVQLFCQKERLDEAVQHCLATEKKGLLHNSLSWYKVVLQTLQDYVAQSSVSCNEKLCRQYQKELLLADCNLLRITLSENNVQPSLDALRRFDKDMQTLSSTAVRYNDELFEVFMEMKGHLYLHTATLLVKLAQDCQQTWRAVIDLAALCYLLAYQVPRPKPKVNKREQGAPQLLELLANDRQSQAGHMLNNLSTDSTALVREVVEAFANRNSQESLFELLFGPQASMASSFIASDDIHFLKALVPDPSQLTKLDAGAILLHRGDLQHLSWLGLQWSLQDQRPALRTWLQQLFPRLNLETSKLDTNAPESICLLDLEVFLDGVVFCSHCQLQEMAKIRSVPNQELYEPRCLPLPLLRHLATDRQRDWWEAVYSLIHRQAVPGTSAKLRMIVQEGLNKLRAGEKNGLQPALVIYWAQCLSQMSDDKNSYYDQKEYISRSVHYWKFVLPLLEKIKDRRNIPEPPDPLFIHFPSKHIQISSIRGYEEEAKLVFATQLDIEGKTEEAITVLESINNMSAIWYLAQIYQRLSEEASNGVECVAYLKKCRTCLSKIYNANADDIEKLPVSMEEILDLLNDVNQQLDENENAFDEEHENVKEDRKGPVHSSPAQPTEASAMSSHMKFSPNKSILSPTKRHMISPRTPPNWVEDQNSKIQKLCQQVEELTNVIHELKLNSSRNAGSPHQMYGESYGAEGLQDSFTPVQSYHGAPLTVATTGPSFYYNQPPAYNSQYLLRTAQNVTPTKGPMCGMNRMPPQQHVYAYQQPTHTPPSQGAPPCIYPPQEPVFGAPIRFESPATSLLSPYSEEYYNQSVPQQPTNPPLPEPGYFTKPTVVPVQPPKSIEGKSLDFGKLSLSQQASAEVSKVPSFGAGAISQSTPSTAFKFNSNFKSNDGDFTFSASQGRSSETLLDLLTSDNSSKIDAVQEKPPIKEQPTKPTSIFTFGNKDVGGFSFNSGQNTGGGSVFEKAEHPFAFGDTGKPSFGLVKSPAGDEKERESDSESTHIEEDEDGPHFEPIVPLPDKIDVKTGEEEEEEMFCNRAKLYRFDTETKEWKERGIGNVKILKHITKGKVRLLMRREQVLKICANHYITADMQLKSNSGCDKSWVWNAIDYANEEPKHEKLAIRFKTMDEASAFKAKFEEAQGLAPQAPEEAPEEPKEPEKAEEIVEAPSPLLSARFGMKEGEWECTMCYIRNKSTDKNCAACQTANPNSSSKTETQAPAEVKTGPFTFKFGIDSSSSKPSSTAPTFAGPSGFGASTFTFGTSASKSAETKTSAFGADYTSQFGKKQGQWVCDKCSKSNELPGESCFFCKSPKASVKTILTATAAIPAVTTAPAVQPPLPTTGFGAQFNKMPGQWECDVCAVRNEASSAKCVACTSPNPATKLTKAAPIASKPPTLSGFGAEVSKNDGTWDCNVCLVRNESWATKCVACSAPQPLGTKFAKKGGDWDCNVCLVRNSADVNKCLACQAPNPNAKNSASTASSTPSFSFGIKDSSSQPQTGFTVPDTSKTFGQSKSSASSFKFELPQSEPSTTASTGFAFSMPIPQGGFKFGNTESVKEASSSEVKPAPTGISLKNNADKDEGKENRTTPSLVQPQSGPSTTGSGGFVFSMPIPQGGFKFGNTESVKEASSSEVKSAPTGISLKNNADKDEVKENIPTPALVQPQSGPSTTGSGGFVFSMPIPQGGFKFGNAESVKEASSSEVKSAPTAISLKNNADKDEVKENIPTPALVQPQSGPSTTGSGSFIFSMPIPQGGLKFGNKESVKEASSSEVQPAAIGISLKNNADKDEGKENMPTPALVRSGQEQNPLINGGSSGMSFADLAKSVGDFQFGQTDPNFNGFSGTGELLFSTPTKTHPSEVEDDGTYQTEDHDDIQFEPVVQMPDKVELVTGEEDEQALYLQRVKLFRFDSNIGQWKERGVGILKFLKNNSNGKLRVLMRREQVLKVCANHWITTTMNLKPLAGSDKAWIWTANDFSDGDAQLQQLAAKFKTPELAAEFKDKFEECQKLLLDIPLQTPHKLVDSGRTAHLIRKAEEMKSGLKDLKSFLTDDKVKVKDDSGEQVELAPSNVTSLALKSQGDTTGPTLEWDNYDLREEALDDTADSSVYVSPIASNPLRKNLFRFGESTAGFSFSFQPGISPSKSPANLNQSRASVGTDDEQDVTQDEERDGQYFEPVIPLPDLVEVSTGEENEQVVFSHRAKLYRYDRESSQWKERGIGDIKILQNYDTKRVRLIMRRDQVLKICANHWITSAMKMEPMKGAEKAWVWSALDFAEAGAENNIEQLAVRFKLQETANAFKQAFDDAKVAQENKELMAPVVPVAPKSVAAGKAISAPTPSVTAPTKPALTLCGKSAIAVLEETTKERTKLPSSSELPAEQPQSPVHPSKAVVSPPKFVFGTDSLQKIFGSPVSQPDTESSPSAMKVKDSGVPSTGMPVFKIPEKEPSQIGEGSITYLDGDSEVEVVYVKEATAEQAALAKKLLLPPTFFCYQNEQGYTSDDQTDDEDFESAVKALNGKLYPDAPQRRTAGRGDELDCQVVWEKKPTPEEEEKAKSLQLPPTFFCGHGTTDSDTDHDKPEDFDAEIRQAQQELNNQSSQDSKASRSGPSQKLAVSLSTSSTEATGSSPKLEEPAEIQKEAPSRTSPIDLSTKKSSEPNSSQAATASGPVKGSHDVPTMSFGSVLGGFSFADLAKNSQGFAFGSQDSNFSWANAGAAVFGGPVAPVTKTKNSEGASDEEEAPDNVDIHFEPIVSLPEVETKSGEEDEEILFKERTKLFRWDREISQWKERGVGDIKILFHPTKHSFRILMRREQVLRVCANHTITQSMELKPMNTSSNALIWTAADYADGNGIVEQLAAKFKTAEIAESFKKTFSACQSRMGQSGGGDASAAALPQMSRVQEHSRDSNPRVFLTVAADGETLGNVTIELFSHIVPKTTANFRALCTGERGFGFRDSVFHRVVPNFMCQGGDITNSDGTGGKSIYGSKFEDENFDVKHTGPGILSMANKGRDTNSSQFFITLKKAEHLDFKHVAFGYVQEGMDVVQQMGALGTKGGKPVKKIVITDCGVC